MTIDDKSISELVNELAWMARDCHHPEDNIYWKSLSTIKHLLAKTQWREIATAPKDGTKILAASRDYTNIYAVDMWFWEVQEYNVKPKPYWSRYRAFSVGHDRSQQPLFWLPLPEPPQP